MSETSSCPECKVFYFSPPPVPLKFPKETKARTYKCYCCGYTAYKDGTIKHGKKFQKKDKEEDDKGTGQGEGRP